MWKVFISPTLEKLDPPPCYKVPSVQFSWVSKLLITGHNLQKTLSPVSQRWSTKDGSLRSLSPQFVNTQPFQQSLTVSKKKKHKTHIEGSKFQSLIGKIVKKRKFVVMDPNSVDLKNHRAPVPVKLRAHVPKQNTTLSSPRSIFEFWPDPKVHEQRRQHRGPWLLLAKLHTYVTTKGCYESFLKRPENPNLMRFFPQESCVFHCFGWNWLKKFHKCEPGWDKHFLWNQEWMFETTLKKLCKRLQVNISKIAEMTICVCKRHAYEWWMKTEETIEDQH